MPLKVQLIDAYNNDLHTEEYTLYGREHRVLSILAPQKAHGVFKATSFTGAATQVCATPVAGGCLELTDIIVSFPKKAGTLSVRFYDGTNAETILNCDMTDFPVNLHIPFSGLFKGWKNAYVDATTSIAATGVVVVGYIKHNKLGTMTYEEWNGER